VATFILDADGQLGEMKGRGNDKPAARYHPYILALLRHDMIRGIKGGGYMPENNFSMSDFDPQTREQLIAKKPELKGLLSYYEEEGMTERVMDMLGTRLRERDLPDYESHDPVKRDFILSTYRDLGDFVTTNSDEILEQLLELRERALDSHTDRLSVKANLDENMFGGFSKGCRTGPLWRSRVRLGSTPPNRMQSGKSRSTSNSTAGRSSTVSSRHSPRHRATKR
jgi:hypothetical protein